MGGKKVREFYLGSLIQVLDTYTFTLVAPRDMAQHVIENVEAIDITPWTSLPEKYWCEIDPRYDPQAAYEAVRQACELYTQVSGVL